MWLPKRWTILWGWPAVITGNGFKPELSGKWCFVQHTLQMQMMTMPDMGLWVRVRVAKIAESTREPGLWEVQDPWALVTGQVVSVWCSCSECHHPIFVGMRLPSGILKKIWDFFWEAQIPPSYKCWRCLSSAQKPTKRLYLFSSPVLSRF